MKNFSLFRWFYKYPYSATERPTDCQPPALVPFLAEAHQHGHTTVTMVTMVLDPVKLFGMSYKGKDPRMVVALALGPSALVHGT